VQSRISILLEPYLERSPSRELLGHISAYLDLLLKWNERVNLTAIREPEEMVRRHFGESLFAARVLLGSRKTQGMGTAPTSSPGMDVRRVIDVGSGAGFPGMVLKLYAPTVGLTLIESQGKKATFLREVVRALGLADVEVVQERAERFAGASTKAATEIGEQTSRRAELVTMRAVEKFAEVLPVAASLVAPGGRLGALIGARQMSEAARVLPGSWYTVAVPESAKRVLAVWTPGQ
jgi:16S rRNA (guanine527-N7)-methyltransferase